MDTPMVYEGHYTGSNRWCLARLQQLADHGLIERITLTVTCQRKKPNPEKGPKTFPKKVPTVYRLLCKGADFVEMETGIRPERTTISGPLSPFTILHRLGVVKHARLPIDKACVRAKIPKPDWIMEHDLYPDVNPSSNDPFTKKFILREAWGKGKNRITCNPDACFLLPFPKDPTWHLVGFIEYCTGSETLKQVAAKLPGYSALLSNTELYRDHWKVRGHILDRDRARVFYVCDSTHKRIGNICDKTKGLPGAQCLRFATQSELKSKRHRLLFDPIWRTVTGEKLQIIPTVTGLRNS